MSAGGDRRARVALSLLAKPADAVLGAAARRAVPGRLGIRGELVSFALPMRPRPAARRL
jgi:hypothetical protein